MFGQLTPSPEEMSRRFGELTLSPEQMDRMLGFPRTFHEQMNRMFGSSRHSDNALGSVNRTGPEEKIDATDDQTREQDSEDANDGNND